MTDPREFAGQRGIPVSDEILTFSDATTVHTLTVPAKAAYCLLQITGHHDVRWRFDTDPTVSVGYLLGRENTHTAGDREFFYSDQMDAVRFIGVHSSGTSALTTYYRY